MCVCVAFLVLLLHVAHIVFPLLLFSFVLTRETSLVAPLHWLLCFVCVCVRVCVLFVSLAVPCTFTAFFFLDEGPLLFSSFFSIIIILLLFTPSPPHLYLYLPPPPFFASFLVGVGGVLR